jgi:hypothetical protein
MIFTLSPKDWWLLNKVISAVIIFYIMKTKTILLPFLFLFLSCAGEKNKQLNSIRDIKVGQSKAEISRLLPAPDEIHHISKTSEIIWGAEEAFWDQIPIGTKIEIWIYGNKDSLTRLYFLNDNDTLAYKVTEPKDVVYEPSR